MVWKCSLRHSDLFLSKCVHEIFVLTLQASVTIYLTIVTATVWKLTWCSILMMGDMLLLSVSLVVEKLKKVLSIC